MERESKWQNWPVLIIGVLAIGILLFISSKTHAHEAIHIYVTDFAAALTTVALSIGVYNEWERRQERKRYAHPQRMGIKRIQESVYDVLYQFAFMFSIRFDKNSLAGKDLKKTKSTSKHSDLKVKTKVAAHLARSDPKIHENLFQISENALREPEISRQNYEESEELIKRVDESVKNIDIALATYGYSFTPEVHKWALNIRESLSQTLTGNLSILSIQLAASEKIKHNKISPEDAETLKQITDALLKIGESTKKAPAGF
jgi:hypothetical protein